MSTDRISTSRRIGAAPAVIFAMLADPSQHVAIDGSGMLKGAIDAHPLGSVGDTFDMDMDRTPLNDIPGLVEYQVRNVVTQIEPDRLIEWTTGGIDNPPVGHVYGWQLEPVDGTGAQATQVTHYCDWSGISDEMRTRRSWPIVPLAMLEASIAKLDRLVSG
ncbi:MAG: polyketide cyclase [Acidimicrobiales bacterium]